MATKESESVYEISIEPLSLTAISLLLLATGCKWKQLRTQSIQSGMTNSNYTELNVLYNKYEDKGLEILAFPCNQFGDEEPGTTDETTDFVCTRFKSEFPIFNKIEVNGENASPLYKFLKKGKWGIFGDDIQWNFAKFLVDKNGEAVQRYYPTTSPLTLEEFDLVVMMRNDGEGISMRG